MTGSRDLLALLREADEQLGLAAPSPRLAARLGAELHRRGRWSPLAGSGGRSLVLALGAAASAVALGVALDRPAPGAISTPRPAEPAIELAGDPPPSDGGRPERTPADDPKAPPPRIPAPLLQMPLHRTAPAPPVPRRFTAPQDTSDGSRFQRDGQLPVDRTSPLPPRVRVAPLVPAPRRGWTDGPEGLSSPAPRGHHASSRRGSGGVSAESAEHEGESSAGTSPTDVNDPGAEDPAAPRNEVLCRTADAWRREARLKCEAQGLVVSDFALLDPCGPGSYLGAEYACEKMEMTTCWKGVLGDGVTCFDISEVREEAYMVCRNRGTELRSFELEQDSAGCAGHETSRAYYECCPSGDPLPSPSCWTSAIDFGDECKPYERLDLEATAICRSRGHYLYRRGYGDRHVACTDATATSLTFTCCPF